jgi:2-(1,2-epoxy-1,2-dihydrophenyl)acetyl-CoA isomerase
VTETERQEPAERDITVELDDGTGVATVTFSRPPNNHFDAALIGGLADAYEELDRGRRCRVIVLRSLGRHFCAGADFGPSGPGSTLVADARDLYGEGVRLFAAPLPVVAAVQGAAIGGGLGLALSADFRVAAPQSRWSANFALLGLHHGFGLSVTLPEVVGPQAAQRLLLTGARLNGEAAHQIGLVDQLVALEQLDEAAQALAAQIAAGAPLAVRAIRATMREGLAERVRRATERERREQAVLAQTEDFAEGVRASAERRPPRFSGR